MYGWQKKVKVTVPATGNIDVPLPGGRPVLEKLTVWATGGERILTGLTFQAKVNAVNFGSAVAHAGPGKLAAPVFQSGDGAVDALLLPTGFASQADGDPWNFVINVASAGAEQEVTMYFAGIGHPGG